MTNWILSIVAGNVQGKIKAIVFEHKFLDDTEQIPKDRRFGILTDKTNFYAESGGQEYDTGSIITLDGETEFAVQDCQSFGGYVLHIGYLKYGQLKIDSDVELSFDAVSVEAMVYFYAYPHQSSF